jgi:hypothetical protein
MTRFSKISEVLPGIIKNISLQKELSKRVIELWGSVVGDVLAEKSMAIRVRDNIIHVNVKSSTWYQQLIFFKKTILDKYKEYGINLKDVRFKIDYSNENNKKLPSLKRSANTKENISPGTELEKEDLKKIQEKADNISDLELRKKTFNFLKAVSLRNKTLKDMGWKKCENCGSFYKNENDKSSFCSLCLFNKENGRTV